VLWLFVGGEAVSGQPIESSHGGVGETAGGHSGFKNKKRPRRRNVTGITNCGQSPVGKPSTVGSQSGAASMLLLA
jgi:hypothetical protein